MLGEQLVAEVDRQQLAAEAAAMQVWPHQPIACAVLALRSTSVAQLKCQDVTLPCCMLRN